VKLEKHISQKIKLEASPVKMDLSGAKPVRRKGAMIRQETFSNALETSRHPHSSSPRKEFDARVSLKSTLTVDSIPSPIKGRRLKTMLSSFDM